VEQVSMRNQLNTDLTNSILAAPLLVQLRWRRETA